MQEEKNEHTTTEDEKIIEMFFDRSVEAVDVLARKYGGLCFHIALNILGDQQDAEECVNDSYLGVWDSIPPQRPKKLGAFVAGVARCLALKRFERNRAEKRKSNYGLCLDELAEILSDSGLVEERLDAELLEENINLFLSKCDSLNRMLFVRRYWYADSYEQLSEKCNMKESAIRTRLSRTRKKLKEFLAERGIIV